MAIAETVIQPYGNHPCSKGLIKGVTETLIDKMRQNVKPSQFVNPNTFLVLNLSMLPPFRTRNFVLRPAYCDHHGFDTAVTGELWMAAFGKPGMLMHGIPEFEGKPCLEPELEKRGLLVDDEYRAIAGIIFMIHPWRFPSMLWGQFRSGDWTRWTESDQEVLKLILVLVGTAWNNELDSNGWCLAG